MTSQHIDLIRRLYPALATGDREQLTTILSPDLVGITTPGLPLDLGGRYEGRSTMLKQFYGRIARHFRAQADPETFTELADGRLLVEGRYTGHALHGGTELDATFFHIFTFADGQVVRLQQLTDSGRWRDALPHTDHPATTDHPAIGDDS
ncbi:nuclear transport factor 2 family protein [Granulicoccus phenolivorans]|uniref:nuclear transport factor 2 family protein n=1 Tax=Granulicoccus phenolivorans TaxID=266854 RepID=UPI0004083C39|nr:nuclear transport factor 2 family protein [Granulicoccus phenolivorans]